MLRWVLEREDKGGMDWISLAQDRDQWRAVVKRVMILGFYNMLGSSLVDVQLAVSSQGPNSVELVSFCLNPLGLYF
jgi:hypothetical protein